MDQDEIGAVLSRATQLHSKICAAIDRSLKTGRNGRSMAVVSVHHQQQYSHQQQQQTQQRNNDDDDAAEVRSLVSIRDALEVLEEQLECLKTLQQPQRAEKDATLAELEESRDILIRRLKQYHGREWRVVREALLFAGEPEGVLPACSYSQRASNGLENESALAGRLDDAPVDHADSKGREDVVYTSGADASPHKSSCRILGGLQFAFHKLLNNKFCRTLVIAAGAAAVLALSDVAHGRKTRRDAGRTYTSTNPQ